MAETRHTDIHVRYVRPVDAACLETDPCTLGLVHFGSPQGVRHDGGVLRIDVGLPVLGHQEAVIEAWTSTQPVNRASLDGLQFACSKDTMFGCMHLSNASWEDPREITRSAYTRILNHIRRTGYEHLHRIWNYIPAINARIAGQERYKAFCLGRAEAFESHGIYTSRLPAATAIGNPGESGLLIYFIAARRPPVHIENPRQVSAYRYPRRYGPRSPSFARASLWHSGEQCAELFISGTASIVGHESRHAGDPAMQTIESLNNIDYLVQHASGTTSLTLEGARQLSLLKIYLRNPDDLVIAQHQLYEHLGREVPSLWLQGDTCREELMIEIEGYYASYCPQGTPSWPEAQARSPTKASAAAGTST